MPARREVVGRDHPEQLPRFSDGHGVHRNHAQGPVVIDHAVNGIAQAKTNMQMNANAGHRHELLSRHITATVDMHYKAN